MKSVFEKYLSNTPKYTNQIQIQIQIFHYVGFQIQIQIQIQKFAYLNTNTNTNTYLTPALSSANGLLPDGNKPLPEPMLAKISGTYMLPPSHNELS